MSPKQPANEEKGKSARRKQQADVAPVQKKAATSDAAHQASASLTLRQGHTGSQILSRQPSSLLQRQTSEGAESESALGETPVQLQTGGRNFGHFTGASVNPGPNGPSLAPALQRRATVNVNDDTGLEHEADVMGQKALSHGSIQRSSADNSVQRAPEIVNNTGLPDTLKTGMEGLSGLSLDDVKVHYNSPKPAAIQAHAYAQGTDIHMAPGQEKHLPHEAWHVVQQKQGRVRPTMQLKAKGSVTGQASAQPVLQARWVESRAADRLRYWLPSIEDKEQRKEGWYQKGFDGWAEPSFYSNQEIKRGAPDSTPIDRLAREESKSPEMVVEEVGEEEFKDVGREPSRRIDKQALTDEQVAKRYSGIIGMCEEISAVINLFNTNEQDVSVWKKRVQGLSTLQLALGIAGGALAIAAIVSTGGFAAIPLTLAAAAPGIASAMAGIGVGAAKGYAEQGLGNAQEAKEMPGPSDSSKGKQGGKGLAVGVGAISGREGAVRLALPAIGGSAGLQAGMAGSAGLAGAGFAAVSGGSSLYKATKVNPQAIWQSVNWDAVVAALRTDLQYGVMPYRSQANPMLFLLVQQRIEKTIQDAESAKGKKPKEQKA